jgi:hypothetical protein
MKLTLAFLMAGIALSIPAPAPAQSQAQYSADMRMEFSDGVQESKVYYAAGKERREFLESGARMITIMRPDRKVMWTLMPADKVYMEAELGASGRRDDLSGYQVTQTPVGQETVNGIVTNKSKIIMTNPKGEKMGGFWWVSPEGIVVRMDAIAVDKDSKERMKIDLSNIQVAAQDAALFEIPQDYTKIGMPGLGGLLGGEDMQARQPRAPDPAKQPPKDEGGFGIGDVLKILR